MSTFAELLPRTLEEDVIEKAAVEIRDVPLPAKAAGWDLALFAEEQIRGLVRQVFLPGWPKPARQVVFSAVEPTTDVRSLCISVGQALSQQTSGTTCVVEALPPVTEDRESTGCAVSSCAARFGVLRDFSEQMSDSLWFMPRDVFLGGHDRGFSALWVRSRLAELRLEFNYTVLQGPAAGVQSEAVLLGSLSDGVVLVLQANITRRVAARRAKKLLHSANARLLGTVLSERAFPIPEAIYKRL